MITYINHPELQKKNYYSPSQEEFVKDIPPTVCRIQLEGSIFFQHSKDYVRVRAKSLKGDHTKQIETQSLCDLVRDKG